MQALTDGSAGDDDNSANTPMDVMFPRLRRARPLPARGSGSLYNPTTLLLH